MTPPGDTFGYDEVPYPSAPYPYSHPDHLAVMARLFGIETAAIDRCRVLEIGCADGANLIPMALTLPNSRFVGIDLSERQIDAGRLVVAQLGLKNIDLHRQDLTDLTAEEGPFDFIIAHGVYSWVPREVRQRLLEVCRDCLAEHGVAFISYNVYPGWGLRQAIREWLMSTAGDGASRMRLARPRLEHLRKLLQQQAGPQARLLVEELDRLTRWRDAYLRHDLLEDNNQPVSYAGFVAHAATCGLCVFADADFAAMVGADLPQSLAAGVRQITASPLEHEQLLDLVSNRAFRQSLVCHQACRPKTQISREAVRPLSVASLLMPPDKARRDFSTRMQFRAPSGFTVDVADPLAAKALCLLAERWPQGAFLTDAGAEARGKLQQSQITLTDDEVRIQTNALAGVLLVGFAGRCVLLRSQPAPFTSIVSTRPVASPLARLQAATGPLVTNLRHDPVNLDPPARQLLTLLDGTRDRDELVRLWHSMSAAESTTPVTESEAQTEIDRLLSRLVRSALLMR